MNSKIRMKHRKWLITFVTGLIVLSAILFGLHYLIFHDLHHISIYTLHDIAFLPVEVLLVTIVIHSLLERQNLQHKLEKLNMVIGAFYSGIGTYLIREFAIHDPQIEEIRKDLIIDNTWDSASFRIHKKRAKNYLYMVDIEQMDLEELRTQLVSHEDFLLRILENPVMLEHESFTEVLRAVFHLSEELKSRGTLTNLPATDLAHLKGDIKRAYSLMTISWIDYMGYLKTDYPYLFSLATRMDPFSPHPDPCVRD